MAEATSGDREKLRRVGVHALLGFACGLPLYLTRNTMNTWFASVGVDKQQALLFGLLSLPFNLKILWAPILDRVSLPWLDRRRDWMIAFQIGIAIMIAGFGSMDPTSMLPAMAVVGLGLAFVSASHDIVVDAYRTDSVTANERGKATGLYVSGYRLAMILGSAGVLLIADISTWRAAYWMVALTMLVGVAATLFSPPLPRQDRPANLGSAFRQPIAELAKRPRVVVILAFIMLYKFGDTVASPMIDFFLAADDGGAYSLTEIAAARKGLGIGAAIVGALIGGFWTDRLGTHKSLLLFGIAQALANVGYAALALSPAPSFVGLSVAVAIDQIFAGMGATAFVAYIMSLCDARYTVAQYAIFTSASTLLGHTLGAGSGYMVADIGWAWGFGVTILVAIPALVLLRWLPDPSIGQTTPAAAPADG